MLLHGIAAVSAAVGVKWQGHVNNTDHVCLHKDMRIVGAGMWNVLLNVNIKESIEMEWNVTKQNIALEMAEVSGLTFSTGWIWFKDGGAWRLVWDRV